MKKLNLFGLLLLLVVFAMGCSATLPKDSISAAEYDEDSFELIGPVSGSSQSEMLLGGMLVLTPDGGYRAAYADALSKSPEANALINVYSDVKVTQYFFGFYVKFETKVYGTAIRVEDKKSALTVK